MRATEVISDGIGRIRDRVHAVADGLEPDQLTRRPTPDANSIGWLLWHLTRVEDSHVAELAGASQLYVDGGFAERLGLSADVNDTGYAHTSAQVGAVRVPEAAALVEYHDAVASRSLELLDATPAERLDEIVDRRWDPPVTAGVRWVSILGDCYEHVGQAAYLKGLFTSA
jgi:hypothetical protein